MAPRKKKKLSTKKITPNSISKVIVLKKEPSKRSTPKKSTPKKSAPKKSTSKKSKKSAAIPEEFLKWSKMQWFKWYSQMEILRNYYRYESEELLDIDGESIVGHWTMHLSAIDGNYYLEGKYQRCKYTRSQMIAMKRKYIGKRQMDQFKVLMYWPEVQQYVIRYEELVHANTLWVFLRKTDLAWMSREQRENIQNQAQQIVIRKAKAREEEESSDEDEQEEDAQVEDEEDAEEEEVEEDEEVVPSEPPPILIQSDEITSSTG